MGSTPTTTDVARVRSHVLWGELLASKPRSTERATLIRDIASMLSLPEYAVRNALRDTKERKVISRCPTCGQKVRK